MRKRRRALLLSSLALCVSTTIVVGATYALFTDEVVVNNHISAGNLAVGLTRTKYVSTELNEQGLLTDKVDETPVNLATSNKPVFEVDYAVPMAIYEATLEIENKGTVAFDYGVRMVLGAETTDSVELASQIEITVTYTPASGVTTEESFMLSECSNFDVDMGYLINGEKKVFVIQAEFLNDEDKNGSFDNNDVMGKSITFDLQVYATQRTKKA